MLVDSLLFYGDPTRFAPRDAICAELEPLGYAAEGALLDAWAFWTEIVAQAAVWSGGSGPDDPLVEIQPRIVLPGLAVWITSDGDPDAIWNLPDDVCILQGDKEAGAVIRKRVPPEFPEGCYPEPVVSGTHYSLTTLLSAKTAKRRR
jgi:hypothetical protein